MDSNSEAVQTANQVKDSSLAFGKDLFYNEIADTTVRLKNGRILKFNKAALCIAARSTALHQMFFGALQVKETEITDIDFYTFKLFLDCVMGYEPFNFENAFKIFPIVWKYQIQQVIDKCLMSLELLEMSGRVSDLLNMALFYNCDSLTKQVTRSIFVANAYKFLEDKNYCHLLEPASLKAIVGKLTMDSQLLKVLITWGKNYIAKNSLNFSTLKEFFEKCDLSEFLKLEYFETPGAILEFSHSEEGKDYFPLNEILLHIQSNSREQSKWINVKANERVTEQINVPVSNKNSFVMTAIIERNRVVFYNRQTTLKDRVVISYQIFLQAFNESGKNIFTKEIKAEVCFSNLEDAFGFTNIRCDGSKGRANSDGCHKFVFRFVWTFHIDCRILLKTRPEYEQNDSKKMYYYTKNISTYMKNN